MLNESRYSLCEEITSPELDRLIKIVSWFAIISMQEYNIA